MFPLHASCLPIRPIQIFMLKINDLEVTGGESGIRTHGRFDPSPVFKTGALNRSAISPMLLHVTAEGAGCHAGDPPCAGGPVYGRTNICAAVLPGSLPGAHSRMPGRVLLNDTTAVSWRSAPLP